MWSRFGFSCLSSGVLAYVRVATPNDFRLGVVAAAPLYIHNTPCLSASDSSFGKICLPGRCLAENHDRRCAELGREHRIRGPASIGIAHRLESSRLIYRRIARTEPLRVRTGRPP